MRSSCGAVSINFSLSLAHFLGKCLDIGPDLDSALLCSATSCCNMLPILMSERHKSKQIRSQSENPTPNAFVPDSENCWKLLLTPSFPLFFTDIIKLFIDVAIVAAVVIAVFVAAVDYSIIQKALSLTHFCFLLNGICPALKSRVERYISPLRTQKLSCTYNPMPNTTGNIFRTQIRRSIL